MIFKRRLADTHFRRLADTPYLVNTAAGNVTIIAKNFLYIDNQLFKKIIPLAVTFST